MVEVYHSVPPSYLRETHFLKVLLQLCERPDQIWQDIFEAKAQMPDAGGNYGLDFDDEGVFASVLISPESEDEEAVLKVQKLDDFVTKIDQEHADRMATFERLEETISRSFVTSSGAKDKNT